MAKNISVILKLDLDFKLLKDQKLTLLFMLDKLERNKKANKAKINALNGMISLLDEIQDQSVRENGVPENTVFSTERYADNWAKKQDWI